MCEKFKMPDGTVAIVCGGRHSKTEFCATCGRPAVSLCDWKVSARKSGTCDRPSCKHHTKEVTPGKHLCPEHQMRYDDWRRRHPGVDVTRRGPSGQGNLFDKVEAA